MNFETLIGDELYQLNLVLWMLQPAPPLRGKARKTSKQRGANTTSISIMVKPIFREAGFKLYAIEPSLPLPLGLREKLRRSGVVVSESPRPDVVMKTDADEFAVVECKKSLFGDGSGQPVDHLRPQRQAGGLLLNEPSILSGALALKPTGVKDAVVAYIFPSNGRADQTRGVESIKEGLRESGFATAGLAAFALEVKGGWIVMRAQKLKTKQPHPPWIPGSSKPQSWRVQQTAGANCDPRPMYIIPWIPRGGASSDAPAKRLFGNRILAWVVMQIGPAAVPAVISLRVDEALRHATLGHFERWENNEEKKFLRRNARDLVRKRIGVAKSEALATDVPAPPGDIVVTLADDETKAAIIEALRGEIDESWNDNRQGVLFPEDEGTA